MRHRICRPECLSTPCTARAPASSSHRRFAIGNAGARSGSMRGNRQPHEASPTSAEANVMQMIPDPSFAPGAGRRVARPATVHASARAVATASIIAPSSRRCARPCADLDVDPPPRPRHRRRRSARATGDRREHRVHRDGRRRMRDPSEALGVVRAADRPGQRHRGIRAAAGRARQRTRSRSPAARQARRRLSAARRAAALGEAAQEDEPLIELARAFGFDIRVQPRRRCPAPRARAAGRAAALRPAYQWTSITGTGECRATSSATEPSTTRPTAPWPRVPMQTRSTPRWRAVFTIDSAGSPSSACTT